MYVLFVLLGVAVGGFGTLIGAGGGFLLTPVLLLCFPSMPAQNVTALSMLTVFFNSASGASAYARMKRVDYRTGLIFAAATLPGSMAGTMLITLVDRKLFNAIFGIFLLIFAAVIVLKSRLGDHSAPIDKAGLFRAARRLRDREGHEAAFSFNMLAGVAISLCVGFLSGFLGIGGGIVHVPALVFLGFPAHFATATSHFVLVFSSFTSTLVHLTDGSLSGNLPMALCIAGGAVVGAQIGARLSKRVGGRAIMICLAAALILAGARIAWMGLIPA